MMNIEIELIGENVERQLIYLKDSLEGSEIEGLAEVQVKQREGNIGEMGIGEITNSLEAIIKAAGAPLTELVKCLQTFIESFKTSLKIKCPNGMEFSIDSKYLNEKGIPKLVKELLEGCNAPNKDGK